MHGTYYVLDDNRDISNDFASMHERRGYNVWKATNVTEARRAMEEVDEPFDVAQLDVQLKDPSFRDITGLDIGLEMKRKWPQNPPQFIVFSSFTDLKYYQRAMELGAAAYLDKSNSPDRVLAVTRALTLKMKVLKPNLDKDSNIAELIRTAQNRNHLVTGFVRWLEEKLTAFLPSPYVVLVQDGDQSSTSTNHPRLRSAHLNAKALTALIYARCVSKVTHQLDHFDLSDSLTWGDEMGRGLLEDAVFLPLMETPGLHVTLGLLQPDPDARIRDSPSETATALAQFFRYPFHDAVNHLITCWTAQQEQKKARLEATSRFCLYVGQEQLNLLKHEENGEEALTLLAQSLHDSGALLETLMAGYEEDQAYDSWQDISLRQATENAWRNLAETYHLPTDMLSIIGEAQIQTHGESLNLVITRALQWQVQRTIIHSDTNDRALVLTIRQENDQIRVVFEDRSRRLGEQARNLLFQPFSQPPLRALAEERFNPGLHFPLFLVRTLAETRLGGSFEDDTHQLNESHGHRFVLKFPSSMKT